MALHAGEDRTVADEPNQIGMLFSLVMVNKHGGSSTVLHNKLLSISRIFAPYIQDTRRPSETRARARQEWMDDLLFGLLGEWVEPSGSTPTAQVVDSPPTYTNRYVQGCRYGLVLCKARFDCPGGLGLRLVALIVDPTSTVLTTTRGV